MRNFHRFYHLAFVLLLLLPAAARADANDPTGLWLTQNHRSVINVTRCGDRLCGNVYWIIAGGMQKDSKNPDETQRSRPMCGLPIIWGMRPVDALHWQDGTIYKADDGDTYHATMQLLPNGALLVHGYIGMPLFGVSQTWERVSAKDYPACR